MADYPTPGPSEFSADQEKAMRQAGGNQQSTYGSQSYNTPTGENEAAAGSVLGGTVRRSTVRHNLTTGETTTEEGPAEPLMSHAIPKSDF